MIEGVVIGVAAMLLGTLIIFIFRLRQLYVVVPNLFTCSALSEKGKIVEIQIFNRGRLSENSIEVPLSPDSDYEILASTDERCSLNGQTLALPRLAPDDHYSVLLLVENENFGNDTVSGVSSSTTKGKKIAELASVPMNYGLAVIVTLFLLAAMSTPVSIAMAFDWYEEKEHAAKLDQLKESLDLKWQGLDYYSKTEFSENYKTGEFPIHIEDIQKKGDLLNIRVRLVNKSAAQLEGRIFARSPFEYKGPKYIFSADLVTVNVEPMSADTISMEVYWPSERNGDLKISFDLNVGSGPLMFITEIKVE